MPKKPDWGYWQNMPHAQAWQLVAISLDISPREGGRADIERFRISLGFQEVLKTHFEDRLEVAVAHIQARTLTANVNAYYAHRDVRLSHFATWAKGLGWT